MEHSIEDELAIRALVDRYCDAVNRRATADWRATWQPDASWELFGRPMEGLDALTKTFEGALGMVRTAIAFEVRDGILYVFMPPVAALEDYLELVAAVEFDACFKLPFRDALGRAGESLERARDTADQGQPKQNREQERARRDR